MKTNPLRRGRPAFTLIELMAVITIIVILAGLVVGGMGFVNERQAKEKAKVQMALLSKAIEDYKMDMGTYPPTGNSSTGSGNSGKLLAALFSEGNDYLQAGQPADWTGATKIYLAELDPDNDKQGWINGSQIRDPWDKEYRYRTALSATGNANNHTQNPDFDLWSVGKDGLTKASRLDSPTATENKDDIRNF